MSHRFSNSIRIRERVRQVGGTEAERLAELVYQAGYNDCLEAVGKAYAQVLLDKRQMTLKEIAKIQKELTQAVEAIRAKEKR